jgi:ABC-type nitrate/sulfonate/bicarbonate transport system substrate-binding protein
MNKKNQSAIPNTRARPLRLGFVPLTDCAPLIMAKELGLFGKFGLHVQLSRELGWATVRDKIVHSELDAAHALAAMPLAATLGLGSIAIDCLTALVLNLHGNAITLSNELWKQGVRDGRTLRDFIRTCRRERSLTFGAVSSYSTHRQLLRNWLSSHGIDPERDVRIVIVPPPQMAANLKAGNLDGFCSGEPWNSVAVQSRAGWIAATSSEIDSLHPEKVLMVRGDFAIKRSEEHIALVAALIEACEFCDQPENQERIIETLALPDYVSVPESALRHGISGEMDFGHGNERTVDDFYIFHRDNANVPGGDKAAWTLQLVRSSGLCKEPTSINFALGRKTFRTDIFERALALRPSILTRSKSEHQTILA